MPPLPPALVLSVVLVLLSAFAYYAAMGRTARGLVLTVIAALIGFVAGETVARLLDHHRGMVGPIHLVHGLVGTWAAMIIARRHAS